MTVIEIALLLTLGVVYVMLLSVFGSTTLGKGRPVLLMAGFLVPPLWVLGAMLEPKLDADERELLGQRPIWPAVSPALSAVRDDGTTDHDHFEQCDRDRARGGEVRDERAA